MEKIKKIKVGPSLKRRTKPRYVSGLLNDITQQVLFGTISGCIPIILSEMEEAKRDFEALKERFSQRKKETFNEECPE